MHTSISYVGVIGGPSEGLSVRCQSSVQNTKLAISSHCYGPPRRVCDLVFRETSPGRAVRRYPQGTCLWTICLHLPLRKSIQNYTITFRSCRRTVRDRSFRTLLRTIIATENIAPGSPVCKSNTMWAVESELGLS